MKQLVVACLAVLFTRRGEWSDRAPDWTGVWQMQGGTVFDRATQAGQGGALSKGVRERPPYNAEWEKRYQRNLKLRDDEKLPDPINTCGTPPDFRGS
jgi:hypothetical protein